jgi:hypothetical protein
MAAVAARVDNKTRLGLLDTLYVLKLRTKIAAESFTKKGTLRKKRVRVIFHRDVEYDGMVIYTFCPEGYSGRSINTFAVRSPLEVEWEIIPFSFSNSHGDGK